MTVYYQFIGQEFYGYYMVRSGEKLSKFNQKMLDSFMSHENSRVYTAEVPY